MTEPNFEQRVTAAEEHMEDILTECRDLACQFDYNTQERLHKLFYDAETVLKNACAIARDYARRPEGE